LIDEDQRERFFKTGYYSKKLDKITEREVRLISLNAESGDINNAYVLA